MRVPWEKLEEAFKQCHALAGEERRAYLNELAKRDTELFVELRKLLDADDLAAADSFFEPGALKAASLLKDHFVGKQIGTFAITELIGEGGMGAVYRAEQTRPFHRLAAIKVIWAANTNEHLLRRFDVEVQTLARLNHPNIASVYFSGVTDNGLPYFCMELVDGLSLDVYCRENSLGVADRLKIFAEICRAVHFAHQRGVIHRDIKPANILIAEVDGRPQVKMIDFGIAKAVQDDKQIEHSFQVTATLLTIPGMAVGTLGYMSPEQTLVSDQDVDLRTDVYALGVVLYELLVGDLPISRRTISEKSWDQIFKAIRDKTPTIPSQAVLNVEENPHGQEGLGKPALSKKYRGDIDWMVMKALAKEPDRRYESALAFAEDCERHLANEPVLARPPSLGYQISRFVKRNKGLSAGLVVVLTALLVGLVGLGAGYYQAKQAEMRMQEEVKTANTTIDVLEEFIVSVSPSKGGSQVKMIDQLDEFLPKIEYLDLSDSLRARIFFLVGRAYYATGDITSSEECFRRARDIFLVNHGLSSNEVFETDYFLTQITSDRDGWLAGHKMAVALLGRTEVNIKIWRKVFSLNTNVFQYYSFSHDFSNALLYLKKAEEVYLAFGDGDRKAAYSLYFSWGEYFQFKCQETLALENFKKSVGFLSDNRQDSLLMMHVFIQISHVLVELGEYDLSDEYLKRAEEICTKRYAPNDKRYYKIEIARLHNNVEKGDYELALNLLAELFDKMSIVNSGNNTADFDYLIEMAEEAARRSGNQEVFFPVIEEYMLGSYGAGTAPYSGITQNGTIGIALFSNKEYEAALSPLLLAYHVASESDHFRPNLSALYAYYIGKIFMIQGEFTKAANWSCVSLSHYEGLECTTYWPPKSDIEEQWIITLYRSDHLEGLNELNNAIRESIRNYGSKHKKTIKLLTIKSVISERR